MSRPLRVVAGALIDAHGRVLIARRPPGSWQAGRWEFPGGKLEAGESEETALARELREELGIGVQSSRSLMTVEHAYADRTVRIALWLVTQFEGEPRSLDGQGLQWVGPADLAQIDLLEADAPFIAALQAALPCRAGTGS